MPQQKLSSNFLANLELERQADLSQTEELLKSLSVKSLVKADLAINNLVFESMRIGLGGRVIVELKSDSGTGELRVGDFKNGDIVKVMNKQKSDVKEPKGKKGTKGDKDSVDSELQTGVEGVISRISQDSVIISVDEQNADACVDLNRVWIVKLSNSITYKRMESTMRKLSEFKEAQLPDLFQILLNIKPFTFKPSPNQSFNDLTFTNTELNESQKRAIQYSLESPLTLVHGPPGTGKTTTLVETILQLTARGERVLVCGPSNISVDTILERLSPFYKTNELIRIGHPSRLLEQNLKHCLDLVLDDADDGAILKELKSEIDTNLKKKIKKSKSYKEKRQIYSEVKDLRKDLRIREKKSINQTLLNAKVIISTLHGSSSRELANIYKPDSPSSRDHIFDTIIIDEISQSLEPQCWIPLIHHKTAKKLILAGDNKQLPPTVKSSSNKVKAVLERTIFDRLVEIYPNPEFRKFLDVQYRMNSKIIEFSSKFMYDDKLKSHESCADIKLHGLRSIQQNETTEESLVWYDTQGGLFHDRADDLENNEIIQSKYNDNEATLVVSHVEKLLDSDCTFDDIGVISPYRAQVALLKRELRCRFESRKNYKQIEVSTVDGFQGREKEVIIISLVRSNDEHEVGFLKDKRRLNVAITRAKRQLVIIGDMETLDGSKNKYLKDLVSYMEEEADLIYP